MAGGLRGDEVWEGRGKVEGGGKRNNEEVDSGGGMDHRRHIMLGDKGCGWKMDAEE